VETRNVTPFEYAAAVRVLETLVWISFSTLPRHNVAHIAASANNIRKGSEALFSPHFEVPHSSKSLKEDLKGRCVHRDLSTKDCVRLMYQWSRLKEY
jgi:hypothetical protein